MQAILIPSERIKVLMNPVIKLDIEKQCNIKLSLGEEEEVTISSKDPVDEWKATDIVKAVGRGFEPSTALKLLNEEYLFKLISLKELFSSEKQRIRYKARVIGTKGKVKTTIEEITDATISIYGNTIGIIGKMGEVDLAERAINMILNGASHGAVFNMLRKTKQKNQETGLY
jgi:ribosomal RNA assembly protein